MDDSASPSSKGRKVSSLPKVKTFSWKYGDPEPMTRRRRSQLSADVIDLTTQVEEEEERVAVPEPTIPLWHGSSGSPSCPALVTKLVAKYEPKRCRGPSAKTLSRQPETITEKATRTVCLSRIKRNPGVSDERKRARRSIKMSMEKKRKKRCIDAKRYRRSQKLKKIQDSIAVNSGAQVASETLFDRLMEHVIRGLRGNRVYTPALVEKIVKVGTAPSCGSRSSISRILTHTGD